MSRRKENVRKSCDEIKRLTMETWKDIVNIRDSIEYGRFVELAVKISKIKRLTHRIKRTTWRGDETNLNKRITDDIKQIAIRSFKNDLSNIKLNNDHAPATDW